MTVREALRGGFGATMAAVLGVVCLAYLMLANLTAQWSEISYLVTKRNLLTQRSSEHLGYAALYFHQYQFDGINDDRFLGELDMLAQQMTSYRSAGSLTDEERQLLDRAEDNAALYREDLEKVRALRIADKTAAVANFTIPDKHDVILGQLIRKLAETNAQRTSTAVEDMDQKFRNTGTLLVVAAVAAVAGLGFAWSVAANTIMRYDSERGGAIRNLRAENAERRQAENSLRETTRMLEMLVRNLPGNVFRLQYLNNGLKRVLFMDGSIVAESPGLRDYILTLSPQQYYDSFPPESQRLLYQEMPAALRERGRTEFTFQHIGTNGQLRWLRAWETVVGHDGDDMITEGLSLDVTEEVAAKQSLERVMRILRTLSKANEALVRATDEQDLFSAMCRVIVEVGGYRMAWVAEIGAGDRLLPLAHAGHEDGFLAAGGDAWTDEQRPDADMLRAGTPQVCPDLAALPPALAWRQAALERGYRSSIALPLRFEDERQGLLCIYAAEADAFGSEETALFLDLANDLSYGVAAMRDRERRIEVERTLAHAQKMEALGRLAGGVAHDFNNLLGAILGFARFIVEDTAPKSSAHYYAQRIVTAGERGKAAVGQILSFARRADLKRELVTLDALATEVQGMAAACLPDSTRIRFENHAPGAVIEGDPASLGRMLLNLCVNAHDAQAGQGGTVTLRVAPSGDLSRLPRAGTGQPPDVATWEEDGAAHCVFGALDTSREHVSVVVADTGRGMGVELLEKAFSPFFTTKSNGAGTGLGLAVVHGVVLAHGGAALVRSRVGQGSHFEIVLPLAHSSRMAAKNAASPAVAPAMLASRVLLVDDDPDFADMVAAGLSRRGAEVTPYADPHQALTHFHQTPDAWDLVVSDHTMPGMSGVELIRHIRSVRPELPCVLCTGLAQSELDDRALHDAGPFALLHKPLDMNQLTETLTQAGRRRTVAPRQRT
ncbi:MAG: ATP-binding protein [Bacteroidales bacterium]